MTHHSSLRKHIMSQSIRKNKTALNTASSILFSIITAGIGFFLAPYIVRSIGVEAQGFVTLSQNFLLYMTIITQAVNSMSGRFITIALQQNKTQEATKYYTSVFWANVILLLVLFLPMTTAILFIHRILNIPSIMVFDVQLLFGFVFINFIGTTLLALWKNTFFITNVPYLQSISDIIAKILHAILLVSFFILFRPWMFFTSLSIVCVLLFRASWLYYYKKKLLPELVVTKHGFSWFHLKTIITAGIWRTIQSVGEILLTGLDLLITNIFINPIMMGVLALSRTIPNILQTLNWQISLNYVPRLTILYAQDDMNGIIKTLRQASKLNAILCTIPLAAFIVFGQDFFQLWVPSQDARMLQLLAILNCFSLLIVVGAIPFGEVFPVVNKIKPMAIFVTLSGVLNTIIVLILLHFTELGVYAIAGLSSVMMIARSAGFTVPRAAQYLKQKWYTFYFGYLYSIIGSTIIILLSLAVRFLLKPQGWMMLILCFLIVGVLGIVLNTLLICNHKERSYIIQKIRTKI